MMKKNRISITQEQRLLLLRELVSIRRHLNEEMGLPEISPEARISIAHEILPVNDLIRKLEAHSPYSEGVHY